MKGAEFRLDLEQVDGFQFRVHFTGTGAPDLTVDEPPPLGKGAGPSPTRLLATSVANCLAASLHFCLRKADLQIAAIRAEALGTLVRNPRGRWRIGSLAVTLKLADSVKASPEVRRCLREFEDFCIVTESVRAGIPVVVRVVATDGEPLLDTAEAEPPASYYLATTLDDAFDSVVPRVIHALSEEGFGVLTDIDVRATLKAKLDQDVPRYRILGACNPTFAHEALKLEKRLGVLLPCNVIVRETEDGHVEVASVDPVVAMERAGNPALADTAREVRTRLARVLAALGRESAGGQRRQ